MKGISEDPEAKCPVDDRTREAWLQAAKAKQKPSTTTSPQSPSTPTPTRFSLDTFSWSNTASSHSISPEPPTKRPKLYRLSTDREISTIPRATTSHDSSALNTAERAALPPANSESDTGHDRDTGNWVYPSQEQFFAAMQRKGHEANPADMSSIVPIHNAVNEKCWQRIQEWEKGYGGERCGGIKLVSFAGDSKKLTPKARWMALLGYTKPFDRHDWVVDRCGKKVEYVIDFYKGRGGGPLAFYLDVRPKVNSLEGVRMRVMRWFGW